MDKRIALFERGYWLFNRWGAQEVNILGLVRRSAKLSSVALPELGTRCLSCCMDREPQCDREGLRYLLVLCFCRASNRCMYCGYPSL